LLILSSYYEWKLGKLGEKIPFLVKFQNGKLLRMAGLYNIWEAKQQEESAEQLKDEESSIPSYTVITTNASKQLSWLHDRMPVILETDEDVDRWLNCENYSFDQVSYVLKPFDPKHKESNVLESFEGKQSKPQ
jgi:putative SOS response-associated peptidase YedK